ncbi:MAG: hypothetical protein COB09_08040 [Thalassobium sp.]|nr:MAG: hypothetical protein COB09_08040 [Thalassobium sp.]
MEADYVTEYCGYWEGKSEVVLEDRTRVDCLTDDLAIEFDWCKKWAEAIGQALYYSKMTGRMPAIALICSPGEERFIGRVEVAAPGVILMRVNR